MTYVTRHLIEKHLFARSTEYVQIGTVTGIVQAVERESGDGMHFNIRLCTRANTIVTVCVALRA